MSTLEEFDLERTFIDPSFPRRGSESFSFLGKGYRIGVMTSGGDSQGMNAAIRGIARSGLLLPLDKRIPVRKTEGEKEKRRKKGER